MAANVFNGRQAYLLVGATSSATGVKFGGVRDFRLTVNRGEVAFTNFDSSGWEITLPGIAKASLTAETVFLSTGLASEQDTLRAAALAGTRKYYKLQNSSGSDTYLFSGWGYVTGFDWGGAVDGPQLQNFSVGFDGKITEA